jgi:hypothetical protein
MTTKVKKIKALLGYHGVSDTDLLKTLTTVYDSMNGNAAYANPPVDLAVFKTAIDSFSTLIVDSVDGGKKTISVKNKQREELIKDVTLLGHFVEAKCNDDLATFNSSGFVAASQTRVPPQPLPPATIAWIDRGATSGQTLVKVTAIKTAVSYELRYAVAVSGGALPTNWTTLTLIGPKTTTINNLTPGATYVFQVRALGKLGYTDFSDPMSFICA